MAKNRGAVNTLFKLLLALLTANDAKKYIQLVQVKMTNIAVNQLSSASRNGYTKAYLSIVNENRITVS